MIKIIGCDKKEIEYRPFTFPCGEPHIVIEPDAWVEKADIQFLWKNNMVYMHSNIINLLLICNALKELDIKLRRLTIPYIPFSRQDRVCNRGEPFSLKVFADLINNLEFAEVVTDDPHSDVTRALFNNLTVREQHMIFGQFFLNKDDYYLISPDAGALKKIYKIAQNSKPIDVIECSKKRDTKTGDILSTRVHHDDFQGKDCYIVDDICDGGRTFIEIAKVLKKKNAGRITLVVTHGFFTKGLEVFNVLIDKIYTSKGEIK